MIKVHYLYDLLNNSNAKADQHMLELQAIMRLVIRINFQVHKKESAYYKKIS